jgi:hypothetical protein
MIHAAFIAVWLHAAIVIGGKEKTTVEAALHSGFIGPNA